MRLKKFLVPAVKSTEVNFLKLAFPLHWDVDKVTRYLESDPDIGESKWH